jgi:hypothetical protein
MHAHRADKHAHKAAVYAHQAEVDAARADQFAHQADALHQAQAEAHVANVGAGKTASRHAKKAEMHAVKAEANASKHEAKLARKAAKERARADMHAAKAEIHAAKTRSAPLTSPTTHTTPRDALRAVDEQHNPHLVAAHQPDPNNNIYNNLNAQSYAANPAASPAFVQQQPLPPMQQGVVQQGAYPNIYAGGPAQGYQENAHHDQAQHAIVQQPMNPNTGFAAPPPMLVQQQPQPQPLLVAPQQTQQLAEQQVNLQRQQARDEHPHLVQTHEKLRDARNHAHHAVPHPTTVKTADMGAQPALAK